ncbi:BglG family transcription antiterminator [Aeribacillus sp. FSL K6-2848]|uniref:BglG family transcription antiterminator n=1 Tax=Aeribacillus sp. FSL K6-2848 TaxID=2954612 RepID=UPI0030F819AF
MFNQRMKTILRELMAAESPITGAYLANLNQVTSRTTREDIKSLDGILAENGANVISVMGKGYKLTIEDDAKFKKFLQTVSYDESPRNSFIPKTPKERVSYLIRRLLLSENYLKLEDIADEMYISKSTIQNDLKHVKQILNKYDIQLESRPNYGIKVSGSELKLRFCMSEYIFDRHEERGEKLYDTHLANQDDLDQFLDIIMRQIKANEITISDIAIHNLLIHIAIAYERIKNGHHVTLIKSEMQEIKKQREYQVAEKIVKEVEERFHVQFPRQEVAYIAIHLLGTKMLSQTIEEAEQVIENEIIQIVKLALDKIEERFHLGIKDDEELILGLSLHLKPAVNRYKYGMNIRNPMLQDIKKNYPLAFDAAVVAGLAIGEYTKTEIDENEIGYLALHIGAAMERKKLKSGPKRCLVVCASGLGTAQLIYYKLKSYFGNNLEVVGITEYYKLKQFRLTDLDFIVSSISIPEKLNIPVIEVNAILRESDLKQIEKLIIDNQPPINTYFRKDLMFLRKNFHSYEEVLTFFHTALLEKGLVDNTFLEAIFEREKVAPTSFGNLVAVPHPIVPKTNQTFIAVCTLDKPIQWKDKPVQLVCMLCVKKNSEENLQEMYGLLARLIDNSSMVQNLLKTKSYEQFMQVLKEHSC